MVLILFHYSTENELSNILIIFFKREIGPSVDDQAVSLSDDGTTIIIDFWSERRCADGV